MAFQAARARAYLDEGLALLDSLDSRSAACVCDVRRASTGRRSTGSRRAGFDVFDGAVRLSPLTKLRIVGAGLLAMKVAVVGGGLAGLSAALELVDAGHEVTLLRGAADARRRGSDAAAARGRPRAAAGQRPAHRARLLHGVPALPRADRRGAARYSASPLALPRARRATAGPRRSSRRLSHCCATGTCLSPTGSRILRALARWARRRRRRPSPTPLRARGQSERAIDRFWDVFIRPALNLPADEASAAAGRFTVETALLAGKRASDLVLPTRPLGEMHGEAAGRALEAAGAAVRLRRARRGAGRARRRGGRGRRPTGRERTLARRAGAGPRILADRERPPALRPAASARAARRAPREPGALGLRPRAPHRPRARARPVPDRRLERRTRARSPARPRAGRADRRRADRAARPGGAALVARQPRAARPRSPFGRGARRTGPGRRPRGRTSRARARGRPPAGRRRWRARSAAASPRRVRSRRHDRRWQRDHRPGADRDAPRRGDRRGHGASARAPARRRLLGRRARVERDDDRAAPVLAPRPQPPRPPSSTARSPTSCWRGSATTAPGRSGSRGRPTSRRRSRPTRR